MFEKHTDLLYCLVSRRWHTKPCMKSFRTRSLHVHQPWWFPAHIAHCFEGTTHHIQVSSGNVESVRNVIHISINQSLFTIEFRISIVDIPTLAALRLASRHGAELPTSLSPTLLSEGHRKSPLRSSLHTLYSCQKPTSHVQTLLLSEVEYQTAMPLPYSCLASST